MKQLHPMEKRYFIPLETPNNLKIVDGENGMKGILHKDLMIAIVKGEELADLIATHLAMTGFSEVLEGNRFQ